jgi:hypothetical protein
MLSKRDVKHLEAAADTPALIGWLRSGTLDRGMKGRVANALGRIGDPLAVDALLQACADQVAVGNVMGALAKIGDRRAVEGLVALMAYWRRGRAEPGSGGFMNRLSVESAAGTLRALLGDDVAGGIRECDEALMAGWQRYHQRAWTAVETWADCPLCGGAWHLRVEGAAQCRPCYRYFSNYDRLPHASDGSDGRSYGDLTGTSLWTLTLVEGWLDYCRQREADGLVPLPMVVPQLLTPVVDHPVAWEYDETLMGGALRGGPNAPPGL